MTETVPYRPAMLKPVTSPTELRELTVRDYKRNAERMGLDVPVADLEKLALHDLHMVDAYESGVDLSPKKATPKKKVKPEIVDPTGGLPFKAPPSHIDSMTVADFMAISARWPFAMGRMKRILAGATPNRDPLRVAMTCEVPELALKMVRLHRNWLLRGRDSRHNPFRGLSEIDARRALVRFVEDICDQSSGRMGPWWVPK